MSNLLHILGIAKKKKEKMRKATHVETKTRKTMKTFATGNVYENIKEIFKLRCATSDEHVLRCSQE